MARAYLVKPGNESSVAKLGNTPSAEQLQAAEIEGEITLGCSGSNGDYYLTCNWTLSLFDAYDKFTYINLDLDYQFYINWLLGWGETGETDAFHYSVSIPTGYQENQGVAYLPDPDTYRGYISGTVTTLYEGSLLVQPTVSPGVELPG